MIRHSRHTATLLEPEARLFQKAGLLVAFAIATVSLGLPLRAATADETTSDLAEYDERITQDDREHWAYRPVGRPELPNVQDTGWVRSPIDRFILARLEASGLKPNPQARPADLLRRLYLDLIGLPPTIAEQDHYLANPSAEQLDEESERLLHRPGFGERWARHWLDLVRYAESNGYEDDTEKPNVWRYRDYVVGSFNNDKPFDRFILEQLAGDELPEANAATLIPTGFYRLGPWDSEPADAAQDRHDQLNDMIRATSQVFLGLTLGCARCHDHKFDALTMHDYYRMSAIFAPLERPRSGLEEFDAFVGSAKELSALAHRDRRLREWTQQQHAIRDSYREEYLRSGKSRLPTAVVEAFQTVAAKRDEEQRKLVAANQEKLNREIVDHLPSPRKSEFHKLQQATAQLRQQVPDLPRGYFFVETNEKPPQSFLLQRGRAATPGPVVLPGLPSVLVTEQPRFEKLDRTSGRRLVLANWVASPGNPLTARVIVNRMWQYHFGAGIVRSPSDFGVMGDPPTHRQLLDWLAYWFVHDANWSLKRLHRLIVRSNTYRMSKSWTDASGQVDPENRLFWRFPYRRLQVEAIRDSILASSGELNRSMYGRAVKLDIPRVVVEGNSDLDAIWKPSSQQDQSRRTLYAFVKRTLIVPLLEVFDLCDTTRSTASRNITSVAPQALTLFNGDFVNHQARFLADRVIREVGSDPKSQIDRAFRHVLCRMPSDEERIAMVDFRFNAVHRNRQAVQDGEMLSAEEVSRRTLIQVCRVIYNLNEFVYPN